MEKLLLLLLAVLLTVAIVLGVTFLINLLLASFGVAFVVAWWQVYIIMILIRFFK